MGKFLSTTEKHMLRRVREMIKGFDEDRDGYTLGELDTGKFLVRRNNSYEDIPFTNDEVKELIKLISDWFGMFVKRPKDISVMSAITVLQASLNE